MSENVSNMGAGAYTTFKTLYEAEEFAYSLSGTYYKVLVYACNCGCDEADVFSIPPGGKNPATGEAILKAGPYRPQKDLMFGDFNAAP